MKNPRIAALLMAALMLSTNAWPLTLQPAETEGSANSPAVPSQWNGKRVAFLGDSITDKNLVGNITAKSYWQYLAETLGLTPYVYAINGNRMDGVLKQARQLREERGDSIDAILIFAGTNDYNTGIPIGEWYTEQMMETQVKGGGREMRKHREVQLTDSTFKGRINLVLHYLKSNYPTKQVILLTPIHRAYARFGANVQPEELFVNKIGIYLEEYVEAVKQASNVWSVPVIDLNALCGLYPLNDTHAPYFHDVSLDRLHPNAAGHHRMAQTLLYQLLALPASF